MTSFKDRASLNQSYFFENQSYFFENQSYSFENQTANKGTIRETSFLNALHLNQTITYPIQGDFNVNGIIFEVGRKNKNFDQIKHLTNSFLALDDIKIGQKNTIPLWLFGFLH